MTRNSDQLYLSVVTIAEIGDGIAKALREGATRKAADLAAWLDMMLHLYQARLLVFDTATAAVAGVLSDRARAKGIAPGFADIMIAATAHHHDLIVLTRNLRHIQPLGVPVLDPFSAVPPG